MIRPDVVQTLVDTNLATLVNAMDTGDQSLIRMADGNPPTTEALQLILSATAEDLDAADELWKHRIRALEEGDEPW